LARHGEQRLSSKEQLGEDREILLKEIDRLEKKLEKLTKLLGGDEHD